LPTDLIDKEEKNVIEGGDDYEQYRTGSKKNIQRIIAPC